MAEVFGVVTGAFSVVTLLDQIISSIDNLRALRSFVKNAPTELQDLIEDAEIVQGVLETLSPESLGFLDRPATGRRLLAFQKDLEATIEEMRQYTALSVAGRKIGAVKLAWKKEAIRARRQNLDNIKGTLVLLQGSYCSTSIREHNASIRDLAAAIQSYTTRESTKSLDITLHKEGSEDGHYQLSTKRQKRSQKPNWKGEEFQLRVPLGFINKVWTLQTKRLTSGWTFTIQTHNVISDSSPIFRYCAAGDVDEVQRLFSSRLASPVDCTSNGTSLLSIATFHGQLDMCQMLLNNGAHANHKNYIGVGPMDYLNVFSRRWVYDEDGIPRIVDLYRLMITVDEDEDLLLENRSQLPEWFSGIMCPPEALDLIQKRAYIDYAALPLSVRFSRAMMFNNTVVIGSNPLRFQTIMGGRIDPDAYLMEDENGETLLHKVAECMAMDLDDGITCNMDGWRQMLREAVEASANLSKPSSSWKRTPLINFLHFYNNNLDLPIPYKSAYLYPLRKWVSELKAVGVDLEEYGANERAMHRSGYVAKEIRLDISPTVDYLADTLLEYELLEFKLLDFTYGPEPEDWFVWVTDPTDVFVGDFWELVERQQEVMPGTWVD
ncbi:hypothetical protein BJY01DRAFT_143176 [Aspergillus pseudoustus]|uniref:Fungal N-terminal domain-containing protein n=1 Tax=Aspergillus pseudoustus TaxID=1810923 RepID=A0ABR4IG80_9EURO